MQVEVIATQDAAPNGRPIPPVFTTATPKARKQSRVDELDAHAALAMLRPQTKFDFKRHFHFHGHMLTKLDALESLFFERELKHLIPDLFMIDHRKINMRDVLPIDRSAGAVAETITFRQFEEFGEAKIISDYATDLPAVEVLGEEFDTKVRSIGKVAMWSVQEIRAARALGRPLDQMKARAARKACMRKENSIAIAGDALFGLSGLQTDTNIPEDIAAGVWSAATAAVILAELNTLANSIGENSGDAEEPQTIIMPTLQFNRLAVLNAGLGTDTTVLQFFLANNPYIDTIIRVQELAGTFTAGADGAFAYDRSADKLRLNIPLDLEQFSPEQIGMMIKVIYHMRVGGVTIHKPLSLRKIRGI